MEKPGKGCISSLPPHPIRLKKKMPPMKKSASKLRADLECSQSQRCKLSG